MTYAMTTFLETDVGNLPTFGEIPASFWSIKNWFYPKNQIQMKQAAGNKLEIESIDEESKYVTFLEKGTGFALVSEEGKKIVLGDSDYHTIRIRGQKTKTMKLSIYFIQYDRDCQRLTTHKLLLNELTTIQRTAGGVYARLAIRLEGKGKLMLEDVFTSSFAPIAKPERPKTVPLPVHIKIATILEKSYATAFEKTAKLVPLSITDWQEQCEKQLPDLLWIQAEQLVNLSRNHQESLHQLLLWCETNDVPKVCWITAPLPSSMEEYVKWQHFDQVLVANPEQRQEWAKLAGESRVDVLLPTAAPDLFQERNDQEQVHVYVEQTEEANQMTAALEKIAGVQIFSVTSELLGNPQLFHDLAAGIPAVTNAKGSWKRYFHTVVNQIQTTEEAVHAVKKLQQDREDRQQITAKGIREMNQSHTPVRRMEQLLDQVGIRYRTAIRNVTMLFFVDSADAFQRAIDIIHAQTYERKRAVLLITPFPGYEAYWNANQSEHTLLYMKDYALTYYQLEDIVKSNYVAIMRSDYSYDTNYLADTMAAIESTKVKRIGCINGTSAISAAASSFTTTNAEAFTIIYEISELKGIPLSDLASYPVTEASDKRKSEKADG